MKKSIIIQGKRDIGKSTTIQEVCKVLNPSEIYKIDIKNKKKEKASIEDIFNDTFLIKVKGRWILVVAGAPTEQGFDIEVIIDVSIEIEIDISFALVSMRERERTSYSTKKNLEAKGYEIVHIEKLIKIESEEFEQTQEWKDRIRNIVEKIQENI